jgi:hypothetical protein
LDTNIIGYILNIAYIAFIFGFSFFSQKLQVNMVLGKISKSLFKLQQMSNKAKDELVVAVKEIGKPEHDPKTRIEELMQFFFIRPIAIDPAGVVNRVEHLLDTADERLKQEVKTLAPAADETQLQNLTNLVETAKELDSLYRTVRHYYLAGKKSGTMYSTVELQMQLPMIMEEAEAYYSFIDAYKQNKPIGDGIGPLVASKLMADSNPREIVKEMIAAEIVLEDRKVLVTKAKGPGGSVGKAGDAVTKLFEENDKKLALIMMIDAGLKLEGEDSGYVVEGVGAAIGGVGVEKYRIEELATEYKIPVYAMVVKQSLKEVLSPMSESLIKSADVVLERLRTIIRERTKPTDTILVVGVGNTIGIA